MKAFLLLASLALIGCGGYDDGGSGGGNDPALEAKFKTIQPIIQRSCAVPLCHATSAFVSNANGFKNSTARTRISNGSMPVPGTRYAEQFTESDKQTVLNFFK